MTKKETNKTYNIEITPKTIIVGLIILACAWLAIKLHTLIFMVFIAFSIAAMLSPVIEALYRRKVPKMLSIVIIYVLFFSFLVFLILVSYKPIATQIEAFINELPNILINITDATVEKIPLIRDRFNWDEIFQNIKSSFWDKLNAFDISDQVLTTVKQAFGIFNSIFGALLNIIFVIVLSVYFIQFKEPSKQKFVQLLHEEHRKRIFKFLNKLEKQLGAWLRAQLLLMFMIGFLVWLGLEIVDVNFSIPLGITSGFLEAVPGLGPTISMIFALIVGIGSGLPLWKIIFIIIWFVLIQQIENYIIVPKLMQKIVGINPMITIIAIIAASQLFGIVGTLFAIPIVAILQISINEYINYKNHSE